MEENNFKPISSIGIYVTTWKNYNENIDKGYWIELNNFADYDEFFNWFKEKFSEEKYPELAILDVNGAPSWITEFHLNEYGINGDVVWDYMEMDADEQEMINEYVSVVGNHHVKDMNVHDILSEANDAYIGDASPSFTHWVIDFFTDTMSEMPVKDVINYHSRWIDYDSVGMSLDNWGYYDVETETEKDIVIRQRCQTLGDLIEESWLDWDYIENEMKNEYEVSPNGKIFRKD